MIFHKSLSIISWYVQVFSHMKAAAKSDTACAPNVITYSALMTACCTGGRPDKAYELFRSMPAQDIRPDHICYSTLIAGGHTLLSSTSEDITPVNCAA